MASKTSADKLIFHMDVNSAFLSWESVYRLKEDSSCIDLRTIPSAVGGDQATRHGIILAKSTSAKKFGVTTGEPISSALKKCPGLTIVRPRMKLYREYSSQFISLLREYVPVIEQYSIDEVFCDMTGTEKLYGTPLETAYMLKDKVRDTLGFTVNVGISTNRLLAKMAGDFEKPDKVHTLFPDEIPEKMWPLSVHELFSVGKSTAEKLCKLGIFTIGELAATDISMLKSQFGEAQGQVLHEYARGISSDVLHSEKRENKGYGNSVTLAEDVTTLQDAYPVLLSLSDTVCARLRADGKRASRVTVSCTTKDFKKISHQKSLLSSTDVTNEIYLCACELLREMWDGHTGLRLLGVTASQLGEDDIYQYSLFDMTAPAAGDHHEKLSKMDRAVDDIRRKFGSNACIRSSLLKE